MNNALQAEINAENTKIRQLRLLVDIGLASIYESSVSIDEALDLLNGARDAAEDLFPGSSSTFDLIYKPRFLRAIKYRFGRS